MHPLSHSSYGGTTPVCTPVNGVSLNTFIQLL